LGQALQTELFADILIMKLALQIVQFVYEKQEIQSSAQGLQVEFPPYEYYPESH